MVKTGVIGTSCAMEGSLGIPVLDGNKGKIVITTRFLDVCKRMMTNKDIEVPYLSENEAWELFLKRRGDAVNNNLEIQQLAKIVVQECGGLPLTICAVGGSLRNEANKFAWQNALRELRSPEAYEVTSDMDKHLFKLLKFSYDRLKHDNLRKCFLFAALYPEDFDILKAELIEYWIAEGFIDNKSGSINRDASRWAYHSANSDGSNSCRGRKQVPRQVARYHSRLSSENYIIYKRK